MFRKDAEKMGSFLGAQSEFQGELISKGILRIDGCVTAKIQADHVILSETAFIGGEITAKKIIVGGKVEGSLRACYVEIMRSGKVSGEIFTDRLVVTEGGEFNGRIEMRADEARVLEFEVRKPEIVSPNSKSRISDG